MGVFSPTQTIKSTKTTTPITPDWLQQPVTDAYGRIHQIGADTDPLSLVSPLDPLQTQAGTQAAGLTPNPGWDDAAGALQSALMRGPATATAASGADNISKFYNPYQQQVIDSSLADFDADRDQQTTGGALQTSGHRAGSGGDIYQGQLAAGLGRARATLDANLRSGGFDTAANLASQDATRQTQTSQFNAGQSNAYTGSTIRDLADLFTAQGADNRSNIATLADVGGTNRGVDTEQRNAPLNLVNWQDQQYAGLGPLADMFDGETETTSEKKAANPSTLGKIGTGLKIAGTVASLFGSDYRIKTDIRKIGERPDGLGVYLYRYVWSPVQYIGVMAQEVLRLKPRAVVRHPSGFLMVDYSQLGA